MGWTVTYQFVRAELPTPSELAALSAVSTRANADGWDGEGFGLAIRRELATDGVIAEGMSKLGMSMEESEDADRMVAAINAALAALPQASLRLRDDFEVFGVDSDGRCTLTGVPTDQPIDVDSAELVALTKLVPPAAKPLPASLRKVLAAIASGGPTPKITPTVTAQAMAALDLADTDDPRRAAIDALLESLPILERASVGLARYPSLANKYHASSYIRRMVDDAVAAGHVQPLVAPFLSAWRRPKGLYYFGDMSFDTETTRRLAQVAEIREQMAEDVRESEHTDWDAELVFRRAERAIEYLASSGAPGAIAQLIDLLRRYRGEQVAWRLRSYTLNAAVEMLGRFPHPAALATLILALPACAEATRARDHALRGIAKLAPDRAVPLLRRVMPAHVHMYGVAEALAIAGTAEARELLGELLAYPLSGVRRTAEEALGVSADLSRVPPLEARLVHPDEDVRHHALQELAEQGDRSVFVSLVLAHALSVALQRRRTNSWTSMNWDRWPHHQLVPDKIRYAEPAQQLAWAEGEGATRLGPQTILDAVAPVRARGVAAVVATYPEPRFELSADETAGLLAEEAGALASLTD